MNQTKCKVCGQVYPESQPNCPRCGCPQGATVPAYLRCKRCGTVLSSRHRTCPHCGQAISPQTATVVLLRDVPASPSAPSAARPARRTPRPAASQSRGRQWLRWSGGVAAALVVLVAEGFLVKTIYANITYRECLDLWNCGGSVAANRRAPDPVYEDTVEETLSDSLADVSRAQATDSIDRASAAEEIENDSLDY